jgi:2-polyprenyl-3-methyl-5-hydroxy-6-metoxy-1,4-benzoquinol methylase
MKLKITNAQHIKSIAKHNANKIQEIVVESELDDLIEGLINHLDDWPLAVNPSLIVDTSNEEACKNRAKNIIEMVVEQDLKDKKVLDFGCGDGFVTAELLKQGASKVVGYDIKAHKFWGSHQDIKLTTDWQEVKEPFDFILIYDVLDHVFGVHPSKILTDLKTLLAPNGVIVLRCHPWVSRHATHLYTQINKAFIHFIFSNKQLKEQGYNQTPTRKIVHPLMTYKKWFDIADLKVIKEDKITEPVEDYFLNNELLKALFQRHFADSPLEDYREGKGDLGRILGIHFIDYVLKG